MLNAPLVIARLVVVTIFALTTLGRLPFPDDLQVNQNSYLIATKGIGFSRVFRDLEERQLCINPGETLCPGPETDCCASGFFCCSDDSSVVLGQFNSTFIIMSHLRDYSGCCPNGNVFFGYFGLLYVLIGLVAGIYVHRMTTAI
jgi:hypothetical protein